MNENLARQTGSAMLWKGGQLLGDKIIFLCRTLIVARLLTPDDFGLLAISMIGADFLLSVTDFGMVPALVQRPDVDEGHYDNAWTANLLRALGVSLVVFLAAPLIAALFAEPRATPLIRVVAIRPLLQASASIKVADLIRGLRFRSLTYLYIPEALVNTIVSIALAPYLGVWALIAGALAGPAVFALISYAKAPYRPRISLDPVYSRPLVGFGQWIFLTSLAAVVGSSVVQIVISRQLGAVELGLYTMAAKLAFIPYEVSTKIVSDVAFPLYARLQSEPRHVGRAFRAIFTGVSVLVMPVCSLMIALAPSLVESVLGPGWEGTTDLIRLLALISLMAFVGDTFVPILKGMGRPNSLFAVELAQTSVLIVSLWGFIGRFGVNGAALAWLPAIIASQIVGVFFLERILSRPFAGLGKPLAIITVISAVGATIALVINHNMAGLAGFIVASSVAAVIMGGLLCLSDRCFALDLSEYILQAFPQMATLAKILPLKQKA